VVSSRGSSMLLRTATDHTHPVSKSYRAACHGKLARRTCAPCAAGRAAPGATIGARLASRCRKGQAARSQDASTQLHARASEPSACMHAQARDRQTQDVW
jgi:hypothetical protein